MSPGSRRCTVFGMILGAHVLLGYVLERGAVRRDRAEANARAVAPMFLSFIEKRVQRDPPPFNSGLTPEIPRPLQAPNVSPLMLPPMQFDPEPTTPGLTDWDAAAHDAIAHMLDRAQRKPGERRSGRGPELTDDKPGVFGSAKENHHAGTVEDGTRFWVTDNCYYDFPRGFPPSRMAGEFHLRTRTCKPPPTGGGEHMFEELKPESLRTPPKIPPR
jgi:hypothetical protein